MPRNVEIKARIASVAAVAPRALALADGPPVEIAQDDTFFPCADGRLKLRAFSADAGELIFYRRPDHTGPKESSYLLAPTAEPERLREVLSLACGTAGRVRKQRTLFHAGRTRIHLDQVEGLGDFLELEVVLADGETTDSGIAEANDVLARLGIGSAQLVAGAYIDLLAELADATPAGE